MNKKPSLSKKDIEILKKLKQKQKSTNENEKKDQNIIIENGIKKIFKPAENQLNLSEVDLEKKYDRLLQSMNPNAPKNIVKFSYVEESYKFEATVEQTEFHFKDDGCLISIDSQEGKEQLRLMEEKKKEEEENKLKKKSDGFQQVENHINQFNFIERATQTMDYTLVGRLVSTKPPPSMTYKNYITQGIIYDTYLTQGKKKLNSPNGEEKKNKKSEETETEKIEDKKENFEEKKEEEEKDVNEQELKHSSKIMERMILQNVNNEILEDFKYWDDKYDEFRETGSLLPLWNFRNEKTKKKQVTSLKWNSKYHDLFAVGYGSFDFMKQNQGGAICCYSLKNPINPESMYIIPQSGVMSIDFHPTHSSLLSVGLYNGQILVYDIRQPLPINVNKQNKSKHSDVVWEVCWDKSQSDLNLFSISSDGSVGNWNLKKNELEYTVALSLKKEQNQVKKEDFLNLESGTCLNFSNINPNIYLVGTEEGEVHECSKAYTSQYINSYSAHDMSVYSVKWNYFSNIFMTSGADWTVKIWRQGQKKPFFNFDLGSPIGDIEWAPYSSSVFAAITNVGKIHVFDLNVNKNDSLCDQLVVKKAKLTKLKFNPVWPILVVGDDKGLVQTLKLSPNLRKKTKLIENETLEQAEKRKINSIIIIENDQIENTNQSNENPAQTTENTNQPPQNSNDVNKKENEIEVNKEKPVEKNEIAEEEEKKTINK